MDADYVEYLPMSFVQDAGEIMDKKIKDRLKQEIDHLVLQSNFSIWKITNDAVNDAIKDVFSDAVIEFVVYNDDNPEITFNINADRTGFDNEIRINIIDAANDYRSAWDDEEETSDRKSLAAALRKAADIIDGKPTK